KGHGGSHPAGTLDDGGDLESSGLSLAPCGQEQAAQEGATDRCDFCQCQKKDGEAKSDGTVKRWSVDGKATVKIGDFSRGGQTRGDAQAFDHDLGCKEKYTPCGMVDEESAQLAMVFGSSYKTSDFLVDTLEAQWHWLEEQEKAKVSKLQIKMDNGPESSGRRTQFLSRMVECAD